MAPVISESSTRSNITPYTLFTGQVLLVFGLTVKVLLTARRAAKSLPPATGTRSQQPLRRKHAIFFSTLAFMSLASVTVFAVMWRAMSYVAWAETKNQDMPNTLWEGWYGAEDARWHLGDWTADIDLVHEWGKVAVRTPEGFLSTSQHFVGLLASAIFMGVEGHRRNLDVSTIASFVVLSATGSLGYSLSLFFVTILYTPTTVHNDDTPLHDALFTPSPMVYYVPIVLSLLSLNWLPEMLRQHYNMRSLRLGYILVPLFLAFAPQIVPVSLGRQHTSKAAAHRSYNKVFHFLSIVSFFLYWRLFVVNVSANEPNTHRHVWDIFTNSIGAANDRSTSSKVLAGISTTGQKLKQISKHPAISVTSLDVLFTIVGLLAWTFTRNLDVEALLDNSVLAFFVPKHEKHVVFEDDAKRLADLQTEAEPEAIVEAVTPKKRGRPAKGKATTNGTSEASSSEPLRRSTRRGTRSSAEHDSDVDSAYEPSTNTLRDVAETESDGATTAADIVEGGESTAVALCLLFGGGLGQLAAGALGAEATGTQVE